MAGINKALKAGTVVFKAGDKADGMYLVRKGELVVYLEQAGKEVILARIPDGGMVGEMALFDQMPRSASVKASKDTEITHITTDDFSKLMKQIPKWFVGLMSALSGRLRTTNERLKSLETNTPNAAPPAGVAPPPAQTGTALPFQGTMRIIHIMELLWHREGSKDGKEWIVQRKLIEDELAGVFGESLANVNALLEILCGDGIIVAKVDSYKNNILAMPNRGSLRTFATFLTNFVKSNPKIKTIPETLMTMSRVVVKMASKAPYDQFTVTLEELIEEGLIANVETKDWKDQLSGFAIFGDIVKLTKTSSKSGIGLRISKPDLLPFMKNLNIFNKLVEKKLNQ